MGKALYFDEISVGDTGISPSYTFTEARINAYAELTGDFTPVHTSEEYAKTTPFGTRVAHGLFGLSVADGLKTQSEYCFQPGMSLGWEWSFVLPIKIGDTCHIKFHVESVRESKSRPGWGIVIVPVQLINQRGEVVQKGQHRVMVPCRPQDSAREEALS